MASPLPGRAWRTREGHTLLEGQPASLPEDAAAAILESSGVEVQPAEYRCVSDAGEVIAHFGPPIPYSLDDELGVTSIHAVVADRLMAFYFRRVRAPEVTSRVELDGLVPLEPSQVPPALRLAATRDRDARERWFAERADALARELRAQQEGFDAFEARLRALKAPVHAVWTYDPTTHAIWLVRTHEGEELGRGPCVGHGLRVFQQMHPRFEALAPPGSTLETELTPSQEMSFYPD